MTVVVLDGDSAAAAALISRLDGLGFASERSFTAPSELVLFAYRGPDCLAAIAARREELLDRSGILVAYAPPSPEDLVEAMRAGVTDVLEGSASDEELRATIERNLEKLRLRRQPDPTFQQHMRDLERDQRAGHYIQMGMLPPNPMAIDRYRLRHRIRPSLMLSGDFVDYFRITDDHFVFYIADVSGHGASSAFVTVILKNFSRRLRREYRPTMLGEPGEILVWLNREILENEIDKHVAMFVGVVDLRSDTMTYANAGHFPHAIHVSGDSASLLELTGKPIGLFREVTYNSATATLGEGDSLVMLSDGVLEVMSESGLQAKENRLLGGARGCDANIESFWKLIGVDATVPGPDDMTCLMVTREA